MAGSCEEEVQPNRKSTDARLPVAIHENKCCSRKNSGKDERVRESTMAPKIAIWNAKFESNHIEIWNNGANYASHPDTLRSIGRVEARSNAQGRHCV